MVCVNIVFRYLDNAQGLERPSYATPGSSGFDIRSAEDTVVPSQGMRVVKTGIVSEIPQGFEVQIRSRSGLAAKSGVFVLNSPGTIDADYRGEWCIILFNTGEQAFHVGRGDRIAQGVVSQVIRGNILITRELLSETERGAGGFGHTGVK